MKNILCVALFTVFIMKTKAQTEEQVAFINKYKDIAITERDSFSIPVSITLAQALLESKAGMSEIAVRANNFFGIKCKKDWKGDTILHNDDRPCECFRKYPSIDSSFRDHSYFLVNRTNYAGLFSLEKTNYKEWAFGLKQAGYATEKNYAYKLIYIIELYKLDMYDRDTAYSETQIKWPANGHP